MTVPALLVKTAHPRKIPIPARGASRAPPIAGGPPHGPGGGLQLPRHSGLQVVDVVVGPRRIPHQLLRQAADRPRLGQHPPQRLQGRQPNSQHASPVRADPGRPRSSRQVQQVAARPEHASWWPAGQPQQIGTAALLGSDLMAPPAAGLRLPGAGTRPAMGAPRNGGAAPAAPGAGRRAMEHAGIAATAWADQQQGPPVSIPPVAATHSPPAQAQHSSIGQFQSLIAGLHQGANLGQSQPLAVLGAGAGRHRKPPISQWPRPAEKRKKRCSTRNLSEKGVCGRPRGAGEPGQPQ